MLTNTNSTSQAVTNAPVAVDETINRASRLNLTRLQNSFQCLQTCHCREAMAAAGGTIGTIGGGYGGYTLNTLFPSAGLCPLLICSGGVSAGLLCALGCYCSVVAIDNNFRSQTFRFQPMESDSDPDSDSDSEEPDQNIDYLPPSYSDLEPLLSYDSPPPYSSVVFHESLSHHSLSLSLQSLPSYEEAINSTQTHAAFGNEEVEDNFNHQK